ncbi:DUF805 domain-containing protein [Photobacterium carnosum]|jgi:uncharacterized membrane protein YhaH (DUF805 family)|uniref:DUF805 domain-containing protein n=1 Tax=Photobacterium carnosum TaxID=2023717 RepID=A0A2N4UNY9_9GAMM|nr:DUF805 domain-containing protein [Photobacterium carnosum]MCD9496485.1 DUF805 domain-containing protein [Photobacterium carnosum]MCD9515965.1 DUF805 domain-containing protein [Photobacterium carnosum]MCD9523996.1 DUF805 domain-containing protein [Photobacterium carnosum]MCD9546398.1 DUF805 domain-containing protein [Photobacterium carnosum]MCD9549613.1 DUF805 domain-containing protein [Photobacterium carnosum]
MNWYFAVIRKYAQFQGRSRRKEFWFFTLINACISLACSLVDTTLQLPTVMEGYGVLGALYAAFAFIPTVAVTVRRLHDQDRTGWWALIMLIPIVGILVLLYFMVQNSTEGSNRFGRNPKQNDNSTLSV